MHCLRLFMACLVAIACACSSPCTNAAEADQQKPNVIFILTDNHGPWTLGCYGNPDIRTPNIDRLAKEGTLFTRAFAPNAVCSPTRATLLTGLLPSQHGVHCFLRTAGVQMGPNAYYTLREFRTLPKILAEAGYACGMAGKWHLGANLQPQDGFTAWITMPHGATATFYGAQVIEHGAIRKEPAYLTELWTRRGVEFIEKNKDQPFFLYLPYNGPYGLGKSMLEPAKNRHATYYADLPLPSFPREPMHPWLDATRAMHNNPVAMRRYAAELSGVDDGVGEIMATLKKHGLDERTLVVFTGDQGWAGGQSGLWGMGDHTKPLSAFDCQITVPLIYRQPGRIKAGQRVDLMVNHYDFLTTLLHHLGLGDQLAAKPESPGRNYAPVLRGETVKWDNVVFYEFENIRAIRTERWKYIARILEPPAGELYDLPSDPGERHSLFDKPEHADVQKQLRERLHEFFARYADPKWDLWKGGKAKSDLLTGKLFKLEGLEKQPPQKQ